MAAYIKFTGIEGDAQDTEHQGWSNLTNFSEGMSHDPLGPSSSGRRRGVIFEDLQCSKEIDKASLMIADAAVTGKAFPEVEIHLTQSTTDEGRQTYLKYKLADVMVTSHVVTISEPTGFPVEDFALSFGEITATYVDLASRGDIKSVIEYSWKIEESAK